MITVEDLLKAYALAYDIWLDPETERENPTPEYAELIRKAVSAENAELRELLSEAREELADMYGYMDGGYAWPSIEEDPSYGPFYRKLCDALGAEVD